MRYSLSRKDFEELHVLGVDGLRAPQEIQKDLLEKEYPKSTELACLELRSRGFDVDVAKLHYLIKKGDLRAPSAGSGRNRQWSRQDIDRAADYLEAEQVYLPGTIADMVGNIDRGQDIRALEETAEAHPDVPRELFVKEILPGAPGAGVYARVRYRPMTPTEKAEWRARIEQAQHGEHTR